VNGVLLWITIGAIAVGLLVWWLRARKRRAA
jgi:hypothetical protein